MRVFILFLAFFFLENSSALEEVRNNFIEINSLKQVNLYLEELEKNDDIASKAYFAAMFFMKSKYVKFPVYKYSYFKKGKTKLDELIISHPKNIEARYIRFLLQSEMPKFLGYNKNIEEDFKVIINGITTCNYGADFKVKMLNNMLLSSSITAAKSEKIRNILNFI